jgi:hypothetical protein
MKFPARFPNFFKRTVNFPDRPFSSFPMFCFGLPGHFSKPDGRRDSRKLRQKRRFTTDFLQLFQIVVAEVDLQRQATAHSLFSRAIFATLAGKIMSWVRTLVALWGRRFWNWSPRG